MGDLDLGFLAVLLSVELSKSPGDTGQLKEHYFVCEARIVFPHVHHFVALCTEFPLPFYCSMTDACKIFLWFFATCPSLYVSNCVGFASTLNLLLILLSMSCNTFFLFNCLLVLLEKQKV